MKKWCATPSNDTRRDDLKGIDKHVKSSHPRAAPVAALKLVFLSNWYSQHAVLDILEGRPDAWADLDRVLRYTWWNIRIDVCMTLVSDASLCLAHAIAFEEWDMARWLAERLIASMDDLAFKTWECSSFGVFMLRLWALHQGRTDIRFDRPDVAKLGVYEHVLRTWASEDDLQQALSEMCDYHLKESFHSHGYPQFVSSPYDLLPVDFLAVEVLRKQMGLPTPRPDHPLLATPLASPPPKDVRPRMGPDPLLDRVIKKARDTGFLPADESKLFDI